jgi:hypothetical protein
MVNFMFGIVHLKGEGMPIHPDDTEANMTDAQYLRQLQSYKDAFGCVGSVVRDQLLQDLT